MHIDCLGGGGDHAAMGMRVWSEQVGLVVGFVNSDNPREALCRAAVSALFPLE